jgi:hypothetical protein
MKTQQQILLAPSSFLPRTPLMYRSKTTTRST